MEITVTNGSPKGELCATLQYALFIHFNPPLRPHCPQLHQRHLRRPRLQYTGPFSAEMHDLLKGAEQQKLLGFARLFRDEIWGRLRPTFQADHRFYRKHGMYDFRQTDYGMRLLVAVLMLLSKLPAFRKEYARRTMPEMVRPLQKVVARA